MPVPVSSEETGAVSDVVVVSPSRLMRVMLVSRSAGQRKGLLEVTKW